MVFSILCGKSAAARAQYGSTIDESALGFLQLFVVLCRVVLSQLSSCTCVAWIKHLHARFAHCATFHGVVSPLVPVQQLK